VSARKAAKPAPRQNVAAFKRVADQLDPPVAKIALRARALIIEVLPEVFEVVWERQRNTGYGTGPKKQTEHFAWLMPAKAHVSLGFNYGAELPDPQGLLEGTGAKFRHVKLASIADVERPAIKALLRAATKHRVPPPQPLKR